MRKISEFTAKILQNISNLKPEEEMPKGNPEFQIKLRNEVIFQHNNLIEANYNLSLQEKRIVLWLMTQNKGDDIEFQKHRISTSDFCDFLGIATNYSYIHKIITGLLKKTLTIRRLEENSLTAFNWLSYVKYYFQQGIIELAFNNDMKEFLLKLKDNFKVFKFSDLMQMRSIYAIRIYELAKQYENIGERTINISDLRQYCCITDKLKQYVHLKHRVLNIAEKEINEKSDITIKYEELKIGRKVTAIKFQISKKLQQDNPWLGPTEKEQSSGFCAEKSWNNYQRSLRDHSEDTYQKLTAEYGLTPAMARKLISQYSRYEILDAMIAVEFQKQKNKVKNPKAMLIAAIKQQWSPNVYKDNTKKKY